MAKGLVKQTIKDNAKNILTNKELKGAIFVDSSRKIKVNTVDELKKNGYVYLVNIDELRSKLTSNTVESLIEVLNTYYSGLGLDSDVARGLLKEEFQKRVSVAVAKANKQVAQLAKEHNENNMMLVNPKPFTYNIDMIGQQIILFSNTMEVHIDRAITYKDTIRKNIDASLYEVKIIHSSLGNINYTTAVFFNQVDEIALNLVESIVKLWVGSALNKI